MIIIIACSIWAYYHIHNFPHLHLLPLPNISKEILQHKLNSHIHLLISICIKASIIMALLFFSYRIILVVNFLFIALLLILLSSLLLFLLQKSNKILLLLCIFLPIYHPVIYNPLLIFIMQIKSIILLLLKIYSSSFTFF
jgi:hypothetical protein